MQPYRGFTLVELAIVITIIGLLIGGVIKGQEMIYGARVTATGIQMKSLDVAGKNFVSMYKNLPGDIRDPAGVLNNCNTSPCNVAGNGDSWIGSKVTTTYTSTQEPNTFFLHLKAASLYPEVPQAASDGLTYLPIPMSEGKGFILVHSWTYTPDGWFLNEREGRNWWYFAGGPLASISGDIPVNRFALYDLKFDDGKPFTGDAMVNASNCNIASGATAYDSSNKTPCMWQLRAAF